MRGGGPGTPWRRLLAGAAFAWTALGAGVLSNGIVDVHAADAAAYAWGQNGNGQLGDGTTAERDAPTRVQLPAGVRALSGSVGQGAQVVVDDQGRVWGWGDGLRLGGGVADPSQNSSTPVRAHLPAGARIQQVAANDAYVLALDTAGSLWEWGLIPSFPKDQAQNGPYTRAVLPVRVPTSAGARFTAIAAGVYHEAIALDAAGTAWTWGENTNGDLGWGATPVISGVPVRVVMPAGVRFSAVGAGGAGGGGGQETFVALDGQGQAWAWGDNSAGSVGTGTIGNGYVTSPARVAMPAGVASFTAIAVGGGFTEALDRSGRIWGWGNNDHGPLGVADIQAIGGGAGFGGGLTGSAVAVDAPAGVTFRSVATGATYTMAVDQQGLAWAWGGSGGTLGNGDAQQQFSLTPVRIAAPAGVQFTRLIGGSTADSALGLTGDLTTSSPAPSVLPSTIALSLVSPLVAFGTPQLVVVGGLVAAVATIFTTFPGNLFNLTLEENEEGLRRWVGRRADRVRAIFSRRRVTSPGHQRPRRRLLEFAAVVVIGSALASLNDPSLGWSARSAVTVASVTASTLVGIAVVAIATWAYHQLRFGQAPRELHAIPIGLVVTIGGVLVSRLTSFEPGYLYGVVAGVVFTRALQRDEKGKVALTACAVTGVVGIAAWIGTAVLSGRAHAPNPALWVVFADNVLAALFVAGVVGTLINLLPLRVLSGGTIKAWRTDVWAVSFAVFTLLLVNALLFHGSLRASAPLLTTLVLFVVFGALSVVVRDVSLQRQRRAHGVPTPPLARRLRELTASAAELFEEQYERSAPGADEAEAHAIGEGGSAT